jgi:hypothetical protein
MLSTTLDTKGAKKDHEDVVAVSLVTLAARGSQVDQEDDAQMPLTILAARKTQVDHKKIKAMLPATLAARKSQWTKKGMQWCPWLLQPLGRHRWIMEMVQQGLGEVSAAPPAEGITKAMPVNNGTASAVSFKADGG